jgi:hypothetical protein
MADETPEEREARREAHHEFLRLWREEVHKHPKRGRKLKTHGSGLGGVRYAGTRRDLPGA